MVIGFVTIIITIVVIGVSVKMLIIILIVMVVNELMIFIILGLRESLIIIKGVLQDPLIFTAAIIWNLLTLNWLSILFIKLINLSELELMNSEDGGVFEQEGLRIADYFKFMISLTLYYCMSLY